MSTSYVCDEKLLKQIENTFFLERLKNDHRALEGMINDYNGLIEILTAYDKAMYSCDDPIKFKEYQDRLIDLIQKFNWKKFYKHKYNRRRLTRKYNLNNDIFLDGLQKLQTGDIVPFKKIPTSCLMSIRNDKSTELKSTKRKIEKKSSPLSSSSIHKSRRKKQRSRGGTLKKRKRKRKQN